MDISDNTAPAEGGKKIIILCERVSRDDIKVRFFQDNWEAYGEFKPEEVHKQYAISLHTPPYTPNTNLKEPKQVWIELTKQDGSSSEPQEFFYTPNSSSSSSASSGPKQVELARRTEAVHVQQQKPVNMYNGGCVTNIKSERSIKEERAESAGSGGEQWQSMITGLPGQGARPPVTPYSQVVSTNGGGLVLGNNIQFTSPQSNNELADLNHVLHNQVPFTEYGQNYSPYSDHSQSSYDNNPPGQSPDPHNHLANMASPIGMENAEPTIESILGTEQGVDLSQELKEQLTFLEPQDQQRSAPKRSSRAADNDSASNIIPRQVERQHSNSLHTPNLSTTISSSGDFKMTSGDLRDLSAVLKNCSEVNQL